MAAGEQPTSTAGDASPAESAEADFLPDAAADGSVAPGSGQVQPPSADDVASEVPVDDDLAGNEAAPDQPVLDAAAPDQAIHPDSAADEPAQGEPTAVAGQENPARDDVTDDAVAVAATPDAPVADQPVLVPPAAVVAADEVSAEAEPAGGVGPDEEPAPAESDGDELAHDEHMDERAEAGPDRPVHLPPVAPALVDAVPEESPELDRAGDDPGPAQPVAAQSTRAPGYDAAAAVAPRQGRPIGPELRGNQADADPTDAGVAVSPTDAPISAAPVALPLAEVVAADEASPEAEPAGDDMAIDESAGGATVTAAMPGEAGHAQAVHGQAVHAQAMPGEAVAVDAANDDLARAGSDGDEFARDEPITDRIGAAHPEPVHVQSVVVPPAPVEDAHDEPLDEDPGENLADDEPVAVQSGADAPIHDDAVRGVTADTAVAATVVPADLGGADATGKIRRIDRAASGATRSAPSAGAPARGTRVPASPHRRTTMLAGFAAVAAVVAVLVVLALFFARPSDHKSANANARTTSTGSAAQASNTTSSSPPSATDTSSPSSSSSASSTRSLPAQTQLGRWAKANLSPAAIIVADARAAKTLRGAGFGNVIRDTSTSTDWRTVSYLIRTRVGAHPSAFRSQLAAAAAPLALFGHGTSEITVSEVHPDLGTGLAAKVEADQLIRRQAGSELVQNPSITFSANAKATVRAGQLDIRAASFLVQLARTTRVYVIDVSCDASESRAGRPCRTIVVSTGDMNMLQQTLSAAALTYKPISVQTIDHDAVRLQWIPAIVSIAGG